MLLYTAGLKAGLVLATRAMAEEAAFEKVRRVLAIDLPQPPQLASGEAAEEAEPRSQLAKTLTVGLHALTSIVATAETTWRDATTANVRWREQERDPQIFSPTHRMFQKNFSADCCVCGVLRRMAGDHTETYQAIAFLTRRRPATSSFVSHSA